ncbi:hypothetical protein DAPPUDRAFT_316065 [Daphnia pulex]|uniref:Retrotransposon Copia-like N-terminal domain-containing protein n=1 Tax=Daphnia pulex TaxID=6669 RepID=E9GBL8_DAPPU|nr:hypothetical protein DAPPUDRAFT_316065 [Daphnia pulex]|eukprot:EFX83131.1 hypothetical protein DAPPUDRAFT_316065 [Daphnia pulex]
MANLNQQEGENISKDVSHIPKFNGKNYPSWKYGVWLLFRQHGLTEIVENNATRPAEAPNEEGVVTNEAMKPFSHQTLSQTSTDKGHRTTEEANVATEDIEDREVVGEVNLMQKEEEWSVTTVKKKAISLQTVALEFEMKSNHTLMWQNPRKTRKIMTLACKALLKIEIWK